MGKSAESDLKSDILRILVACSTGGFTLVLILILFHSPIITIEVPAGLGALFLIGGVVGLVVYVLMRNMDV